MTDTGQVPGEGLPENSGRVDQQGVAAPGAYTYLSATSAEDDEDLLLPGAAGAWGNEVPPPAPEPLVETVHAPGPHELSGRDSGSLDLGAARLPHSADHATPEEHHGPHEEQPVRYEEQQAGFQSRPAGHEDHSAGGTAGLPAGSEGQPAAFADQQAAVTAGRGRHQGAPAPEGLAPQGQPAAHGAPVPQDGLAGAVPGEQIPGEQIPGEQIPGERMMSQDEAAALAQAQAAAAAGVLPQDDAAGVVPGEQTGPQDEAAAHAAVQGGHAAPDAAAAAEPTASGSEGAGQAQAAPDQVVPEQVVPDQVAPGAGTVPQEDGGAAEQAAPGYEAAAQAAAAAAATPQAAAAPAASQNEGAGQAQAQAVAGAGEAPQDGSAALEQGGAQAGAARNEAAPKAGAEGAAPRGRAAAAQARTAPTPPPRRPLHLGPPIPDTSASPVRSLADRGPAHTPVRQPGPPTLGPEYLDIPQAPEAAPQSAAPWGGQATVPSGAPAAETVIPAAGPAGAAQAAIARVTGQTTTGQTAAGQAHPEAAPADGAATATGGTGEAQAAQDAPAAADSAPEQPPSGDTGNVEVAPTGDNSSDAVADQPAEAGPGTDGEQAAPEGAEHSAPAAATDAAADTAAPEPAGATGDTGGTPASAPGEQVPTTGTPQEPAAAAQPAETGTAPAAPDPAQTPDIPETPVSPETPGAAQAVSTGDDAAQPQALSTTDAEQAGGPTPTAVPVTTEEAEGTATVPAPEPETPAAEPAAQQAETEHPVQGPQQTPATPPADPAPGVPASPAGEAPEPAPAAETPSAVIPGTVAGEPQPDQPIGQFVPVEGSVPTPPHLAPTPPQPLTLPTEEQPAPSVPAPRMPVAPQEQAPDVAQSADDLDTRGAGADEARPAQEQAQPSEAQARPTEVQGQDAEAQGPAADMQGQPAEEQVRAAEEQAPSTEEESAPEAETARPASPPAPAYDEAEREAVLKVMRERRDIRNGFRSDPIPHEVLLRVLEAAHTAPSVGHSQPWDFVVIRSAETRRAMHELAMRQREAYAKSLPKGRAKQFKELKIEAILDTPVNIVVTADPTRGGRHTLGRHTQPQMAPYSSALAVENLWLAARAEGLGVGWVSFFDEREMVRALGLPEHLEVVAYLCVGYVDEFPDEPELMQAGWSKRRPLSWVVHEETYGRRALPGEEPHDLLAETVAQIRPLDAKALGEAWERQKRMTKPAGALGMLEIISAQLSGLSRQCPPPIPEPAAVAIFAGDHGVHAQGVTPWPQEVTAQMVANFLGGGAVCNAFATQVGAEVCVVDVGVAGDLPATPGLLPRKVRPGTSDMTTGPAMSREEAKQAIEVGIETARDLVAAGNKALLTGEMGIANTTASAALISVFTGADPAEVTGRGTGINDETLARKTEVVRRALELHKPDPADPIGVLAAIGGLEHAAIVGLLLGGASLRTPVILDGVSAGAAALVARAIAPEVLAACIAGHRSAEPGHVAALNKLGLRPLVDLDLRLGEGTGALLALPLVQSTARAMHEVATFDSAGVTEK
ncbi:hypothetical protein GCM10009535_06360 [Streptomyces thermocarboxydovorans]|uniref:Nicotinate-nucleotide--dimethylbenzimidazole phosphoribosyltransferase n=1 Tax=Streptomyces thermocarboxydovorans TaxID=59298 RepID=A0ABP3SCW4_9ACTN